MADSAHGIDPSTLDEADLVRELAHLHETRHETFLHGSGDALSAHTGRTAALEQEYLRRHPERDVDLGRTREGARSRD
ncbi:DUF6158 family protein [Vallicoccus soli]|uniref:Uncharacterized protein n=1 Tax=Vallicoccus soli TaxID=2339232 RepID=A0A3A3ZF98_9ACTN|nr:DUF6158 family protein [Vallicoccus soli]RJK93797.1 hypothetical protein D5H78_15865 [Vallicoccus soli]